jgi:hypothetical protein
MHECARCTTRSTMCEMVHSQASLEEVPIDEGDQEEFYDLINKYMKNNKPKKKSDCT